MYKYKNFEYTLEEVEDAANKENLSVDNYIKEYNIEKTDPDPEENNITPDPVDEGKQSPSQEIMDVTVEEDDTASKSGDFLSAYQTLRQKRESIKRNKRGRIINEPEPSKKFKPEDFKDDSFIDPKFKLPTEGELYIKDTKRKKEIQGIIEESIDPEIATQFETELQQIEKRNPNIADAITQISKDTGGTENIFKLFDFKAAAEENATEVLDLTLETQGAVVDILKEKNIPIERIAQGRISLEDKEDIITEAKAVVLNKKLDNQIQTFTKDFSEEYNNGLKELQYLNNQIDILSGGDKQMDPLDSPVRIENYNNTVKKYNNLYNSLKKSEEEFQNEIETMQAIYTKERGDLFVKNFKKSINKEIKSKELVDTPVLGSTANAVTTLLNESKKILQKGTVAIPQFLIRGAANVADVITGEEEYSMFDAFADQLSVETDKGFSFLPQSDKFKIVDEEGNYDITYGNTINTIAQMAPFSLYILFEARRGDFKNAKKLLSSGYSKSAKLTPKQIDQLNIVQSAWKATVDDNIKSGQELGLAPIAAQAYGFNLALAEGLTSTIMPETAYFKGGIKAVELGLYNSLKNATTKKAVANATKKYFTNLPKEVLEEEAMAIAGDVLRVSSGLGTQNNEFTNLVAQKELIASTILLSGTLGLPGLSRDYNSTKQIIYNQIFNDSNALLNNMQSRMNTLPKDEQGNVLPEFQDEYNALREARIFTTDLVRAVNVSPKNVSSQDLDLIIQKNKLIEEKKELDPAFHKSINDQIAEIDKQIQESKITTTKAETEKKIKAGIINYVDALDNVTYKQLTQDEVDSLIEELPENQKRKFKQNNANLNFGFTYKTADGEIVFVENLDVGKEEGVITTGAHEAVHAFLFKQLEANPGVASTLGISLYEELGKIDINNLDPTQTEFAQRLQEYRQQVSEGEIPPEQALEEALTLFSEAALNGDIKYDTSFAGKIKDTYNSILKRLGLKQEFDSGRDVYNFIKNFNNSLLKGKVSEDIIKGVKEGFKGKLVDKGVAMKESDILKENENVIKSSKFTEASNRVQKSYEEKGPDDAAFEIIQEFKPITLNLARKRKNAPNYNEEELVSEIETGEGGIFDLIRSYKIDSGIPLAAYINSLLPKRVIAASKRILGEEFTADIADIQIAETQAAEPEVIETAVQEELPKIKVAERIFTPEEQTKLKEKVSQELPNITEEQLTFKTLPNLTAEVIAEKLNMPVKKLTGAANFTQAEFGRAQQFIKDNIKTVKLALPQAAVLEGEAVSEELIGTATNVPNKLLKNPKLYTRLERTTKKAGLVPYEKNKNIQDVDILEAVGIVKDKLTKGPRDPEAQTAKGVLNILGRTAANQEVREQGAQAEKISKSKETDLRAGVGDRILFSAKGKKVSNKIVDKAFRDPKEVKKAREALIDTLKLLGIENAIQYIIPTARRSTAKKVKYKVVEEIGNELKVKELDGQNSTRYFLVENQSDFVNNLLKEAFPNDDIKLTDGNKAISVNGKEITTPKFTNISQSPKGFIDGTFENNIQKRVNFALTQRAGMKKIVEALTSLYNNNVIDENQLFMILQTFNSSVEALIRTAAIPRFYFKGTGKTDGDYRYEHTQTASDTLVEIFRSIVKPNTGYTFDQIMAGFDVAIIPKVYDNIINTEHRSNGPKLDGTKTGKLILGKGKDIKRYLTPNVKRKIKEANLPPLNLKEFKYSVPQENTRLLSSKKKAANKNNSKLPKSKQAKKGSTNQLVLDNMKLIDEEINQRRKEFFDSEKLSQDFNKIIENKTGIAKEKKYSDARAQTVGANKGRFKFFIPPSAEDFVGLLYNTLGKGKLGEQQMAWYKENLLDPYARAMNEISSARVALFEDFETLKKDLKIIPKNLRKKIPGGDFTVEQAVRAYVWNKQGMEVPGLDNADMRELISYVANNNELVVFANNLIDINKGKGYPEPDVGWEAGTITTDLINGINTTRRAEALQQWQENVDIIFSKENLNKLQAAYGTGYRKALENILTRMKTGRNRGYIKDVIVGRFTDWINNSVGAIMFFNDRSALLQTISSINFINYSDNNVFKAAKAFGNQKQYWSDFKFLFNSDFLKERRGGLKFNVSESDIADMAKEGGARGVISKILQFGFLPTQVADSFAIASGGATFYRNRLNKYKKEGLSEKEAQEKAFLDFREIAEEAQQSSRPDRISAQQAGGFGRLILAFANTPAQYARLTKKALLDAINNRGSRKENISKAIYYTVVQNIIFNALQSALFAFAFDDEEPTDKEKEKKYLRIANGMTDGFLRGLGFAGAAVATGKNIILKLIDESDKAEYKQKYGRVLALEALGISPPVQSKVKKLVRAGDQYKYAKKGFENASELKDYLNTELYMPGANVLSASTNIPLDRLLKKTDNIVNMTRSDVAAWQRAALFFGWSDWELGIDKKTKKPIEEGEFDASGGFDTSGGFEPSGGF